jgi:protein-tyrosine phosphatase
MDAMPQRLVELAGAFNFRDLGGYPTTEGRVTRWGRLFRSDSLHELTADDVGTLKSMGLATVIDLRTPRELDRTGRGLLAGEPVAFRHLSVIREDGGEAVGAPAEPVEELSSRYLWYLDHGREALAEALAVVADPDHLPLVFHCAAGKDRTGVLAALVLDILGVDPDVIVADYVVTAERMELIIARYRGEPGLAAAMERVPAYRFGVESATMERFLVTLHEEFGGARGWAGAAGVDTSALDRMADELLEPAG